MFSKEDIEKHYPMWKKQYGCPVEETALETILPKFWERKTALRQLFPFDEEGNIYLSGGKEDLTKVFKNSLDLIRELFHIAMPNTGEMEKYIFSGRTPDGMKLVKKLLACMANLVFRERYESSIRKHMAEHKTARLNGGSFQTLFSELPRLPFDRKPTLDLFLQNFYSELAGKTRGETTLMLSVNPYHMLNASHSEKFSSCNKLGGAFQNAPFCAANSPTMAILRLVQKDALIGRAWIGFSVDYKAVVIKNRYGTLNEEHVKTFLDWYKTFLKEKFGITATLRTELRTGTEDVPALSNRPDALEFYQDSGGTLLVPVELDSYTVLEPGEGYCVLCGKTNRRLFCSKCEDKVKTCRYCGDRFLSNDENERLCHVCRKSFKSCPYCGYMVSVSATHYPCGCTRNYCVVCGTSGNLKSIGDVLYVHEQCLTPTCNCCKKKKPLSSFIVEGETPVLVCSDCRKEAPKTIALQYIYKMKQLRSSIKMPSAQVKPNYALAA